MILAAARDHGIDLPSSLVIGDRWRDIEMGLAAGHEGMLVETGYGRTEATRRPENIPPVPVVGTLIEAVSLDAERGLTPLYAHREVCRSLAR